MHVVHLRLSPDLFDLTEQRIRAVKLGVRLHIAADRLCHDLRDVKVLHPGDYRLPEHVPGEPRACRDLAVGSADIFTPAGRILGQVVNPQCVSFPDIHAVQLDPP